jgi:hypothetical protein
MQAEEVHIEILTEEFNRHYAMCGVCQQDGDLCLEGGRLLRKFNAELVQEVTQ